MGRRAGCGRGFATFLLWRRPPARRLPERVGRRLRWMRQRKWCGACRILPTLVVPALRARRLCSGRGVASAGAFLLAATSMEATGAASAQLDSGRKPWGRRIRQRYPSTVPPPPPRTEERPPRRLWHPRVTPPPEREYLKLKLGLGWWHGGMRCKRLHLWRRRPRHRCPRSPPPPVTRP